MTGLVVPAVVPSITGRRRAIAAAFAGNAMEWYDFALYGGSATAITAVLTPGGWAGFTAVFAVFAMSCLFRPLGSLILGVRADRAGRRPTLAATILLMAGATGAIGLLPPWSAIGVAAPLFLLGLRAVQAFSAGGEVGVSIAYLTEFSPANRRGTYGGWYLSTVGVGLAGGLGATALVAALLDPGALHGWGWRIPFLVAVPLGVVGMYLRVRLSESPLFVPPGPAGIRPARVLRDHLPIIRRCFVIAAAYSAAFNVWFLFLPSYIAAAGQTSLAQTLFCALIGLVTAALVAPAFGRISDAVGRRPLLMGASGLLAVAVVPLYLWTLDGSAGALLTGCVIVGALLGAFVIPAFFAEQFPTGVRATGLGLAYGLGSAIIGGTAPLLAVVLSPRAPQFVVPCYLALWAVAALIAVVRSSEPLNAARPSDASLGSPIAPATP